MARRWRESPWAVLMNKRREEKPKRAPNRWVGSSFEIGEIAGINVIREADAVRPLVSSKTSFQSSLNETTIPYLPLDAAISQVSSLPHSSTWPGASRITSLGRETFVTAPSEPQPSSPVTGIDLEVGTQHTISPAILEDPLHSSQTALLSPPPLQTSDSSPSTKQKTPKRPIIRLPSFVRGDVAAKDKGKGKKVHYDLSSVTPVSNGPDEPAPPDEVLQRSGEEVQDTSAGAMTASTDISDLQWGDIVMRGRRFIPISLSALPRFFDEYKHRQTRGLDFEDWQEFMVVWRMDRIELYENYVVPGEEWFRGHKNLSYVIPLKSGRTKLSIYSFVDLTFCITCPPTSRRYNPVKRKWQIHVSKEGTFIYIFKIKCRSRAYDWTWQLWRHLGGQLPPVISVQNPRFDNKVIIDMPAVDTAEVYKVFSRDNVIALCFDNLRRSVRNWKYIIERQVAEGRAVELAWRRETHLDWIWLDDDVDGKRRDWAVLCGLVLKESNIPAQLEIRLGEHTPRFLLLKDGTRLVEPLAVEGYVDRIRPFGQTKQSTYLSVHDGILFTLNPVRAHPPTPLGPFPLTRSTTEHYSELLRQSEIQRGAGQILDADGAADLRNILVVRRAIHPTMQNQHAFKEQPEDENWVHTWSARELSTEDNEDEGGDDMLQKLKAEDRPKLKMRRSFELLFKNGHVVRFEAYSCRFVIEWVERLRHLVHFWKLKHRNDARDEMDLAQALHPRVTPKTYQMKDRIIYAEPPPDLSSLMPAFGSLYSWCVLEGCKPIVKGGKLFMRQGLRGQFKLVQMFIVAGNIVKFRMEANHSLNRSDGKKIDLMDAYVCSGYFAAQALPSGQYNANADNEARRYQDGLETSDREEDRLFVIWYKSHTKSRETSVMDGPEAPASSPPAPPLDARKKKMAVFRTRSKLERDAWCWALNSEIEKITRTWSERETKMRETGGLMDL
ncbi:hypothetical protein L218DRAFT_978057 [Marasmius fiardii PR-910]|nr:hypothetical protein L218DRAFT_978057 [Marasmius fiardii PR-910]